MAFPSHDVISARACVTLKEKKRNKRSRRERRGGGEEVRRGGEEVKRGGEEGRREEGRRGGGMVLGGPCMSMKRCKRPCGRTR